MNLGRTWLALLLTLTTLQTFANTKSKADLAFEEQLKEYAATKAKTINSWLTKYKQNIKKWELENGLTVLFYPMTNTPDVHIEVVYNVGSKDETPTEYGFAHAVEHMVFKGTDKLSERDIFEVAKKYGAYANAFTNKDETFFLFNTNQNNWPVFLGILADCMQNVRFDEQHFASEVKAIINELKMYNDNPAEKSFDLLSSIIYNQNHPYNHPIIGYKENLIQASAADLKNFYKNHYGPNSAILIVTGNVKEDELKEKVNQEFGKIPFNTLCKNNIKDKPENAPLPPTDFVTTESCVFRQAPETSFNMVWVAPGTKDPSCVTAGCISQILNERLREKFEKSSSLAHNVLRIDAWTYINLLGGFFAVTTNPKDESSRSFFDKLLHPKSITHQLLQLVEGEVKNLTETGVTDEELARYKKMKLTRLLNTFLQPAGLASILNQAYLIHRNEFAPFEEFDHIKTITSDDIKNFCKKYLKPNLMHMVLSSSISEEDTEHWNNLQKDLDAYDKHLLNKKNRTSPLEEPKFANQLPAPTPLEFNFQKPDEIFELENGLSVILKHRSEEPFVYATLGFKNTLETDLKLKMEKLSFVSNYSLSFLNSDTKWLKEKEIKQFLDHINASIYGTYFSCLPEDFEFIAELFVHILTMPAYPSKILKTEVSNAIYEIQKSNDNPEYVLGQTLMLHLFKDYPWVKTDKETIEELASIKRKDLVNFHDKYMQPQNMFLVVVGNFDKTKIKQQLQNTFKSWHKGNTKIDTSKLVIPEIQNPESKRFIKPFQTEQCLFAGSRITSYLGTKELLCLDLFNKYVNSQLFKLREQTGIFYGCWFNASTGGSFKTKGYTAIGAIVSKDNLNDAELAMKKVLSDISQQGLPEEEFLLAKNIYQSRLAECFSTSGGLLSGYAEIYKDNLGWDYYNNRLEMIKKLTLDEVNKVAKIYLNPAEWTFILTGRIEEKQVDENEKTEQAAIAAA